MTDAAPKRAYGRSLADFPNRSKAETLLLEKCRTGEIAKIDVTCPNSETNSNRVRAGFVRFLALGGDARAPVHEQGIQLQGAWLTGDLDLEEALLPHPLFLWNCRIGDFVARNATLPNLNLEGCRLAAGLLAAGLRCTGNVFLRDVKAGGAIELIGAGIGGNLECKRGIFDNNGLFFDRVMITGKLFLDDRFTADGLVRLTGAKIGALTDTEACWPKQAQLLLDGIRIDRLADDAPTSGEARVRWLRLQPPSDLNEDFKPQPWEETIRVLREMGHDEDARLVAIAKQDQMRKAGKVTSPFLHAMWGELAGYGYRPLRLVGFLAATWLFSAAVFWAADTQGVFAPTSPVLQTDAKARAACRVGPDAGRAAWTRCTAMPDAYTTFQPLLYSLDLILPLVDLQQELDWAPAVTINGEGFGRGIVTRWVVWFEILFGWVASLMLVAILTNLVKKD